MLILTRKPGESLFIGDAVKVTVMEIKGNQIRLGIDAPKELRIYREEIYLQIIEENKMASDVSAAPALGPFAFSSQGPSAGGGDDNEDSDTPRKLVVKPISGLNSMRGSFSAKKPDETQRSGESFKSPEVIRRKKKKLSEE